MPRPPKNGKEDLRERRELIRSLLARGINKPSRILRSKAMEGRYENYKNPYDAVKSDLDAVRKENIELSKLVNGEIAKGELMAQYEETLQKAWTDLSQLHGRARVEMMKFIHELNKDIARLYGIDPERIESVPLQVNVDNSVNGPANLIVDSDEFMEKELEFAKKLIERRRGNVGGE